MLQRLWQTSPELIVTAALMVPVLAGALVGLALDPRRHYRRAGVAEAGQVRSVDCHLYGHAGLDFHVAP